MKHPARWGSGGAVETDDELDGSVSTIPAATDKNALTALVRRWRLLGLGCPRGCPLDHHEEPCHLAGEVDR